MYLKQKVIVLFDWFKIINHQSRCISSQCTRSLSHLGAVKHAGFELREKTGENWRTWRKAAQTQGENAKSNRQKDPQLTQQF